MPIEYLRSSYAFLGIDPIPRCSRLPSLLHMHNVRSSSLRVWYIAVLSSINICPQDPHLFFLLSIYTHGRHTAQLSYLLVIVYAQIKGCKTRVYLHKSVAAAYSRMVQAIPHYGAKFYRYRTRIAFIPLYSRGSANMTVVVKLYLNEGGEVRSELTSSMARTGEGLGGGRG